MTHQLFLQKIKKKGKINRPQTFEKTQMQIPKWKQQKKKELEARSLTRSTSKVKKVH
jgi:hypothetical protein